MPKFFTAKSTRAPQDGVNSTPLGATAWSRVKEELPNNKSVMKSFAPMDAERLSQHFDIAKGEWGVWSTRRRQLHVDLAGAYGHSVLSGTGVAAALRKTRTLLYRAARAAKTLQSESVRMALDSELSRECDTSDESEQSIMRLLGRIEAELMGSKALSGLTAWDNLRVDIGKQTLAQVLEMVLNMAPLSFAADNQDREVRRKFLSLVSGLLDNPKVDDRGVKEALDAHIKPHVASDRPMSELYDVLAESAVHGSTVISLKKPATPTTAEMAHAFAAVQLQEHKKVEAASAATKRAAVVPPPPAVTPIPPPPAVTPASGVAVAEAAAAAGQRPWGAPGAKNMRTVRGCLNMGHIKETGVFPPGVDASQIPPINARVGGDTCPYCVALSEVPITKIYNSKTEYQAAHGGATPYNQGGVVTARRIEPNEVILHGPGYCPFAWKFYNKLAEADPKYADINVPLTPEEVASALKVEKELNA